MDAVELITGTAMPLDRSDVDTDQIIPAEWLKRVERTGFGEGLFGAWRRDREFVVNDVRYQDATILIAGPNFGVGSSREHAVWALADFGFRAVISPRFGDIFRNNCTKCGLVPAQIDAATATALMAAVQEDPTIEITVDIVERMVRAPSIGLEAAFPLDDFTQWRLTNGLDDIGITLRHETDVTAHEAARSSWLPVTTT